MGDGRVASAIGRLERALTRLEAAASRPRGPTLFESSATAELRRRHDALRRQVEGAVARIDTLLAGER